MELRLASEDEDLQFLYQTRKHPDVDKMLSGTAPEDYLQHLNYIKRVQEEIRWIFVAVVDNIPVGYSQIYNVTREQLEVGFVIHPDFQGKGFGKEIVKSTITKALEFFPDRKISLYVKKENIKAISIYHKLDFVDKGFKDDTIYMEMK